MPRRRVYKRDSRGRFSGTGRTSYVKGRKGKVPKGRLTGTPVGKGGLPIVERYPGGTRNSRALQKKLMAEGHSADSTVIRSFNTFNGGYSPRKGYGTYNFVARHPKTGRVTGTGVMFSMSGAGKGTSRSVTVYDLFRAGGRGNPESKGAGAHIMVAGARLAKSRDLGKGYKPTEFAVSGALPGAKEKFYMGKLGGTTPNKESPSVVYTSKAWRGETGRRDRLAGKKVRVRIMRKP